MDKGQGVAYIHQGGQTIIFVLSTTGGRFFVECLLHSAKAALHLTKPLSSATLSEEALSNPLSVKAAMSSAKFRALGKAFAKCRASARQIFEAVSRRSAPSIFFFAECNT